MFIISYHTIEAEPVLQKPNAARWSSLTFSKLQFVKNGRFTGSVKTDHKDSHLLLAELCTWKGRNMGEFEAKKAKNSLRRGNDRVPTLDSTETHVKMSTGHMGFLEPISLPPWTVHSPAVQTIHILTMRSKMREKVRPMFTVCFSLYTTIRMYSDVGNTMRTKEMVLNALFVYVGNGENCGAGGS